MTAHFDPLGDVRQELRGRIARGEIPGVGFDPDVERGAIQHEAANDPPVSSPRPALAPEVAQLVARIPAAGDDVDALHALAEEAARLEVERDRRERAAKAREDIANHQARLANGDITAGRPLADAIESLRKLDPKPDPARVLGALPMAPTEMFKPMPPIAWISRGLQLGPGRCNLLVGYSGSAKSMLALSLCLSVASERPILGQFPTGCDRRVRYVSADSGTRAVIGRTQRLARGMGVGPSDLAGRFDIIARPRVPLTDPKALEAYTAAATGVDLLVIDALRPLIPGVEENASEVRAFIDLLTDVSEATGCTVLLLHHEGKSGGVSGGRSLKADDEAARGSSSIQDAGGTIWRVVREEKDGGDAFLVKMSKAPEEPPGPKPEPFYLRIADVEVDGDARGGLVLEYHTKEQVSPPNSPTERADVELAAVEKAIHDANAKGQGLSLDALSIQLGIHDRKARRYVDILAAPERRSIVNRPIWDRGEKPRWWVTALAPPEATARDAPTLRRRSSPASAERAPPSEAPPRCGRCGLLFDGGDPSTTCRC